MAGASCAGRRLLGRFGVSPEMPFGDEERKGLRGKGEVRRTPDPLPHSDRCMAGNRTRLGPFQPVWYTKVKYVARYKTNLKCFIELAAEEKETVIYNIGDGGLRPHVRNVATWILSLKCQATCPNATN